MKLKIDQKTLTEALSRIAAVAPKKAMNPMLANVKLVADNDKLSLAATDLVSTLSVSVECEVATGGCGAVSASAFLSRVRAMPAGDVVVETKDDALVVRGGKRRFKLPLTGIEGFPEWKEEDPDNLRQEDSHVIADLINGTAFSMSGDDTRLHLSSALLELCTDGANMATTDGHRMTMLTVGTVVDPEVILIPGRGITELKKVASTTETLRLGSVGSSLHVSDGDYYLTIKLVDASFPPYKQIIPKDNTTGAKVDREVLVGALRAVMLATSDTAKGVRLTVGEGGINVESESPEAGEGSDEIDAECNGDTVIVGLNGTYLIEALTAMESDQVVIRLGGSMDPLVLVPAEEPDDTTHLAVIMPMRI